MMIILWHLDRASSRGVGELTSSGGMQGRNNRVPFLMIRGRINALSVIGKTARSISLCAMLSVGISVCSAAAEERAPSVTSMVRSVMPSVVMIQTRALRGSGAPVVSDELGSGFIVDASGIIVTNRHVIEDAYSITVDLLDGTHLSAKLIGKGATFDIAFLKVEAGRPLPVARLGDSDSLRQGDQVIAIGNPLGFANSVSSGIVSAFHRDIGLSAYDDLIQTDTPINHGNSGGPLFNLQGEVIGINQAIRTENQGGSIGISFSIPANQARFVLDNIKTFGKPRIGWLGVSTTSLNAGMRKAVDLKGSGGVIISSVSPNSPAAEAGLMVGDIIQMLDGSIVPDSSGINRKVAASAGKKMTLQIVRGGTQMSIPLTIESLAGDLWISGLPEPRRIRSIADLGATLGEAPDAKGIPVLAVIEKSLVWASGIRSGDVIKKVQFEDVHTVADLQNLLVRFSEEKRTDAIVLVSNDTGARWINLSLSEW